MGLYIGSPTNIIIGDALKLTFIDYAKLMMLPALFSCILSLGILFLIFSKISRNKFIRRFTPITYDKIKFSLEMKIKLGIFLLLLISLSFTSFPQFKVPIWIVCLFFAFITLIFDFQLHQWNKNGYMLTLKSTINRLPFGIIPFALCFFTLIDVLQHAGITGQLVNSIKQILFLFGNTDSVITNIWAGIFTSTTSATLVNFLNDLPSSVFIGDLLHYMSNDAVVGKQLYQIIVSSSLIGVNPGCNMSMIGALAGLMWFNLLIKGRKGDEIMPTLRQLSLYGIPSMYIVVIFTSLFVVFQSYFIKI
jgi:Na+/H+ antiporter NhaD/arsenite permease-like protein